jgi:hypothetical protein
MKPVLEQLGYKLNGIHYLYVFSQKSGELIKTVNVEEMPDIEALIKYIVDSFRGLAKMTIPPRVVCRHCPKCVKAVCSWYPEIMRKPQTLNSRLRTI